MVDGRARGVCRRPRRAGLAGVEHGRGRLHAARARGRPGGPQPVRDAPRRGLDGRDAVWRAVVLVGDDVPVPAGVAVPAIAVHRLPLDGRARLCADAGGVARRAALAVLRDGEPRGRVACGERFQRFRAFRARCVVAAVAASCAGLDRGGVQAGVSPDACARVARGGRVASRRGRRGRGRARVGAFPRAGRGRRVVVGVRGARGQGGRGVRLLQLLALPGVLPGGPSPWRARAAARATARKP